LEAQVSREALAGIGNRASQAPAFESEKLDGSLDHLACRSGKLLHQNQAGPLKPYAE
jgi:hypothetical protein